MSDLLQSGRHPDADQLNAFVEHALPDHELQQTLAHLAVCPDCRAIVALSLPPVEESAPEPRRKSWFSGWNLAWPAVAALAVLVLFFVYIRNVTIHQNGGQNSGGVPSQIAASRPPAPIQPPANPQVSKSEPPPILPDKRQPTGRRAEAAADAAGGAGGAISANARVAIEAKNLEALPKQDRNLAGLAQSASGSASIHGQLSTPGGNTPGAGVAAMKTPSMPIDQFQRAPISSKDVASGSAPIRSIEAPAAPVPHMQPPAPAPPASAPSTAATASAVEVANTPVATVSALSTNVALNPAVNTISQHLPSSLPALSMVSNGHQVLAIDTRNSLFFSDDDGTTWNAIPAQWGGHAVRVDLASSSSGVFHGNSQTASFGAIGGPISSQTLGASSALTGTVTDRTGAVIPDASVVISNATTPKLRTVKTDRTGRYLIDALVPDKYQVEVEAPGFLKQQLDVTLTASQQSLANFTLSIGAATATVTVDGSAAPIDTLSVVRKKDAAHSAADQLKPVFEMTTDTGERWTSTDGHTWKRK